MPQRKIMFPIAALAIVAGLSVFTVTQVSAQTNGSQSTLASLIAQKFGLNETEVQTVVDEFRSTKRQRLEQNMRERESAHLQTLVGSGKITAEQKTAIEEKQAEIRSKIEALSEKDLTMGERHAQMQMIKTDAENWAQAQGIDKEYVRMGFGGKMGGSEKHRGFMGEAQEPPPTE